MATAVQSLTPEEFHSRYNGEKPNWEYWHGEAIQKSVPTFLHGLLQRLIMQFLVVAGYEAASEVELRIEADWNPVPDVIACTEVQHPYPTKSFEIVVEVLSPDDKVDFTLKKCRRYGQVGIQRIYLLDPEGTEGWEWNAETESLRKIVTMELPNGTRINLTDVWRELNRRMSQHRS